ncbi:20624_t:CDS:2, partial [Funneliformis geosporum]
TLMRRCFNIEYLDFSGVMALQNDVLIIAIIKQSLNLRYLEISHNNIGDEIIEADFSIMKRSYFEITHEITKILDYRLKKIKIVDLSVPGWFSCSAIYTETYKKKIVHQLGEEFTLPFTITSLNLAKRNKTGLFKKKFISEAQRGENFVQKHFIDECTVIIRSFDEIQYAVLDIRVITAQYGKFSDADVGHATSFGEKLLQLNHVEQSDDGVPAEGWKQLVTLLSQKPATLGWVASHVYHKGEEIKLIRSIGVGRTAVVYEGIYNSNEVAIKVLKDAQFLQCFQLKVDVMQKLACLNSSTLLKILIFHFEEDSNSGDKGSTFIVLSPLCKQFRNWRKEDIQHIIGTLKKVHDMNIIHPNQSTAFAGSLETLPDDALQKVIDGKEITYTPGIELISVVRSFYLLLCRPSLKRLPFGENDIKEGAKIIKEFWRYNAQSSMWMDENTKNCWRR